MKLSTTLLCSAVVVVLAHVALADVGGRESQVAFCGSGDNNFYEAKTETNNGQFILDNSDCTKIEIRSGTEGVIYLSNNPIIAQGENTIIDSNLHCQITMDYDFTAFDSYQSIDISLVSFASDGSTYTPLSKPNTFFALGTTKAGKVALEIPAGYPRLGLQIQVYSAESDAAPEATLKLSNMIVREFQDDDGNTGNTTGTTQTVPKDCSDAEVTTTGKKVCMKFTAAGPYTGVCKDV